MAIWFLLSRFDLYTGVYVKHGIDKACSADSILTTIEECAKAKTILDPTNTDSVGLEKTATMPSGCSIWRGRWFFNSMKGKLDGASEPVCKNGTTISKTATTSTNTAKPTTATPASSTSVNAGRFGRCVA